MSPCGQAPGKRGLRIEALVALGLFSAVALSAVACRTLRRVSVRPVCAEASQAYAQAQAVLRTIGSDPSGTSRSARDRVRELTRAAQAAAPDWVAPARVQDDLLRGELRGVEALEAHRQRLARSGEDARELYLAGRLEGIDGEARFSRAAEIEPDLAWARHGLAWSADRRGDARSAVAHARAALSRARDPWERSFFASSLARFLSQAGRREEALAVLAESLAAPDLSAGDRIRLAVESIGIGLGDRGSPESTAAFRRGLDLLREEDLTDAEVDNLVAKMRALSGREEGGLLELSTALAGKRSPARDRLRAELMLAHGPTPLALGLLERSLKSERRLQPAGPLLRAARFAAGEYASAVELWLADLPTCLRDHDGLPRDERLARVVRCARAVAGKEAGEAAAEAAPWFDFGEALVAAGWFREARALAGRLARADLDRALDLEGRAAAGMQLLDSLDDLIGGAGSRRTLRPAAAQAEGGRGEGSGARRSFGGSREPPVDVRDLSALLAAMGPLFARADALLGGERDGAKRARELAASPRLDYGWIGQIVHPGPVFSRADEREGLGKAGESVPGMAREMDRIGRFALIGELSGSGGPDGTVLAKLMTEPRQGAHLGMPWSGSVAWCEGADVRSRTERSGARISAAALHEGYWLDVDSVRGERAIFTALAAEFSGPDAAEQVAQALAVTGLPLETSGDGEARRRERTRAGAALGEASRVRLSILRDRAGAQSGEGAGLGQVSLDELVETTATHEQGHLVDRARFLPLSKHWREALMFLFECGLSPTRVEQRLEYRAELVALCDSPDSRVTLAQVLDAAESDGRGPTAHAAGYEELLEDLLEVLDQEIAKNPDRFPGIDLDRTLVHQLHRLPAEEVRALARRLAEKRKLVR
jgi:hypothetical protein